jgi:hypothetical protein
MSGFREKSCATSHVLYWIISLFLFCFLTKTHLYPTTITPLGVWTTCPNTLHFTNEFNFVWIASYYIDQSFLCRHSLIVYGLILSFFFCDAKSNFKCKYVIYDNFILIQNLSCVNIIYRDLIISRYLNLFKRCFFKRFLFNKIKIRRWF